MKSFVYQALSSRVVFGSGTLTRLNEEADALKIFRAIVVCTSEQKTDGERVTAMLGERAAVFFPSAVMHTPVDVTEVALKKIAATKVDGIIALGGGSSVGLGKALAYRTNLPQLAIPTTYAGSEMTPILGQTEDGIKTTIRSPHIQPNTVIYDVELTRGLPVRMTGTSGLNAIAHAVEAMYAPEANPISLLMSEEGIRSSYAGLSILAATPDNIDARADALQGAWLCGACLGQTSMALHHKLCHVFGGSFNLPHSETHAIVLPHVLAYNTPAIPDTIARMKRATGSENVYLSLVELTKRFGAPTALRDLGMAEASIDRAVEIVLRDPYWNPRPVKAESLRLLIRNSWLGVTPDPHSYPSD